MSNPVGKSSIQCEPFGQTRDGRAVMRYRLNGAGGMKMDVLSYGGIVQRLYVPDRAGRLDDITTGFLDLSGYEELQPYFGALVGRYANRISNGRFTLEGKKYRLPLNNAPGGVPCSLHGGERAFHNSVWKTEPFQAGDSIGLKLRLESPDGDQGYPGKLRILVTYTLTPKNAWQVDYEAECDRTTPVNFTQHVFFNLKGQGTGDILDHKLELYADAFTPVTQGLIPTGEIRPVAGTPFDFRELHAIGDRIEETDQQLRNCGGYDTNFVLRPPAKPDELRPAALLYEPSSGRTVRILTTEPGIQLYTGNFLSDNDMAKNGKSLGRRGALALETQHFPDSPNHPEFPSTLLRPGERFHSCTRWEFTTRESNA